MEFLVYAEHPENADDLFSFIEIDADENMICIDEYMKDERQYHEYPLDLLIGKAKEVVGINPYSEYEFIDRERLYRVMCQNAVGGTRRETGQEADKTGRVEGREVTHRKRQKTCRKM